MWPSKQEEAQSKVRQNQKVIYPPPKGPIGMRNRSVEYKREEPNRMRN
jgi:hypothetical protein